MTPELTTPSPNRGGRPRVETPTTAEATRLLIAHETTHQNRATILRALYRLHKAFVAAERDAREERRVAALQESARTAKELAALKSAEHLRRFATTEIGAKSLLVQIESLKAKVRELELELSKGEQQWNHLTDHPLSQKSPSL